MVQATPSDIKLSGYHDSRLISASYVSKSLTLKLVFLSDKSESISLSLFNCKIFRISDLVPQSIVSRVLVYSGLDIDRQFLCEKVKWATALSDTSSYLTEIAAEILIEKIAQEELFLLLIEPSWGAELVALFSGLEEIFGDSLDSN